MTTKQDNAGNAPSAGSGPMTRSALANAIEALEPFANKLVDIDESESDDDTFREMSPPYRRAPAVTVGDFRRAAQALASLKVPEDEGPAPIEAYDDGSRVLLSSYNGGAHKDGAWSALSLCFVDAEGKESYRDYRAAPPPEGATDEALEADARYINAALSTYSGGPAGEDAQRAWERVRMALADRMVNGQRRLWMLGLPQGDLHPQTFKLVLDFADALLVKLRKAELKYGYSDGWRADDWMAECQSKLSEHLSKGDPLDVAAYAAFCWHHHWSTALSPQAAGGEDSGQGTSWMDLANGLNGPSPDGRPLYEAFWRRQPGGLTVPWEKQAPAIISMWDGIAADAAVLAAVPPASAPSAVWRPIESAPKGQRFIGWLGNRIGVVEHGLHYVKWPHEVGGPTYRDVWNEVRPGAIQPCEPSHWMPLPAPPFSEAPRPDEMEAEGDSGAIPALPSQKPSSPGSNSNG